MDLPRPERLSWLVERSAALVAGGAEPVSGLVLPNAKFFPDVFDGGLKSVKRLLKRVVKHAGLSDIPITLTVPRPQEDLLAGGGGCSSGGCSTGGGGGEQVQRIVETDHGYQVAIMPKEVRDPTVLTVAMVRAVSHVFMKEAGLYEEFGHGEGELAIDLAGTMLGFGVLLANGSYLYSKG
jgi:hypothetical protein